MSEAADRLRAIVERSLRMRRLRWRFFAAGLAAEAGALLALVRDPAVVALLPVLAMPTLVPIMFVGRFRLPNDECESRPEFAAQAAILASCFATHTYVPPEIKKDIQKGVKLKIELRRKFRGLRSRNKFVVIRDRRVFLVVTARSYWLWYGSSLWSGDVRTLGIDLLEWTDEVRCKRADDEVVSKTWFHATKTGKRDLRYRDNHRIWEVRRYGVDLAFADLHWTIEAYTHDNACMFANAFSAISGQGPSVTFHQEASSTVGHGKDDEIQDEDLSHRSQGDAGHEWHDVLGTSPNATADMIKAAYRERLKEYHPDRVAHLGEKLRNLASEEALSINQAYAEAMRRER